MNTEKIEERIEAGVREVFQSGQYRKYLKAMSSFHSYSFTNCMLIYQQKPDAELVAGFQSWKKLGRYVKRGEKAIRILAPLKQKLQQKEDDEEVKYCIRGWKWVSVFDISQTDGAPLPSIVEDHLAGEVEDYGSFLEALILSSRVPVSFARLEGSTHGFFDPENGRIVIDNSMSQLQTIKTLIHETAHSILHAGSTGMEEEARREVEAESTACVVCMHYNLDTSAYSFGYIASWSSDQDLKLLKEGMERIRMASDQIIRNVDMLRNPENAQPSVYLPSRRKNPDALHF